MSFNKYFTELKSNLTLSIPIILTGLGHMSTSIVDNVMVGKLLNIENLAGSSMANAIHMSILIFLIGCSTVLAPLISAAQTQEERVKLFNNSAVFLFLIGFLCYFLLLLSPNFLRFLPIQNQNSLEYATNYLLIRSPDILFLSFFLIFERTSEGLSYTKGVTYAVFLTNIINFSLNLIFIKGLLFIQPMGIAGVALSTLLSNIFMTLSTFYFVTRIERVKKLIFSFSIKNLQFSSIKKIIFLSIPSGLHVTSETVAFQAAILMCSFFSAAEVAANQIIISVTTIPFMLLMGFGVGNSIRIGGFFGEKDFKKIQFAMRVAVWIGIFFMSLVTLFYLSFRYQIPLFFIDPQVDVLQAKETIDLAGKLFIFGAIFSVADGLQGIYTTGLRGMQDTKIPSFIAVFSYLFLCIPISYYLGVIQKKGAMGIWIGLTLGLVVAAFALCFRYTLLIQKKLKQHG